MQEAFAMTPAEAKAVPNKDYLTELKSGGKTFYVYVYRHVHVWVWSLCGAEVEQRKARVGWGTGVEAAVKATGLQ